MKGYDSIKSARRSVTIQILVLLVIVTAICLIGRIVAKDTFDVNVILSYKSQNTDVSDLTVQWERKEKGEEEPAPLPPEQGIPIKNMEVRQAVDGPYRGEALHLSMQPEEPGDYVVTVLDSKGNALVGDSIHVGPFHTAISWATGAFTGDEAVLAASFVLYLGILVIMLLYFLRLKGPLSTSYDAILAAGVFIFFFVALVVRTPVYLRHLTTPAFYPTWQVLTDIASGGKYFVILTLPLTGFFSLLLIISNIELLRHERPRVQNVLGLLLGMITILVGISYTFLFSRFISGSYEEIRIFTTVENVLGIVITYAECIQISAVICGIRAAKHLPERNRDYILILGCGFRKDGTLPPLLRGRVDKAMEFWKRQKQETGKEAVIIPSGGQGRDECMAEAEAMSRYMIGTGFPEDAIMKENKSANTYQNMEFSKNLIEGREGSIKKVRTAYVTTNYHVFRSGVWAGLAGLPAEGIGSRTKWWFWPNAFVRECVGLLANRIVPEVIFLVLITAAIAYISYFAF